MTIHSIDHIVILVNDLEQAIADYTALGFTVVRGGEHPGRATHNALVAFVDGAYLELIAFQRPAEEQRWWQLGQRGGEGLVDYALLPSSTADVVAAARSRGLELEGPTDGGRLRPDGERLRWQTARAATSDLPFLCGDLTPRSLRVPEGEACQHANGVLGVAGLTIAVADLDATLVRYQALLDEVAAISPPAPIPGLGIRAATVRLGAAQLTLVSPLGEAGLAGVALHEHLAVWGEGPYAVAFLAAAWGNIGPLDPLRAHGARLELVS
jgi:catechol 2,3-dioxygenase-like lactoylglutathione lyase family enzyme